jgi:hypothetical protein
MHRRSSDRLFLRQYRALIASPSVAGWSLVRHPLARLLSMDPAVFAGEIDNAITTLEMALGSESHEGPRTRLALWLVELTGF